MPEEINRVLTDHLANWLFCPSKTAVENLSHEGVGHIFNDGTLVPLNSFLAPAADLSPIVFNVGDVMYDLLLYALRVAEGRPSILTQLGLQKMGYFLLTLHRAENTNDLPTLEKIIAFINQTTEGRPVVFPMHPGTAKTYPGSSIKFRENIRIIEPIGYFDILTLLRNAAQLFTDSGGMQKEAYWLKVPCVTLREETEWVETIRSGWNVLYRDYPSTDPSPTEADAYGDGHAAERIIHILLQRGLSKHA
jgi:UDP-N-acetylglucosamine 2-epimerase